MVCPDANVKTNTSSFTVWSHRIQLQVDLQTQDLLEVNLVPTSLPWVLTNMQDHSQTWAAK